MGIRAERHRKPLDTASSQGANAAVTVVDFEDYRRSVARVMDASGVAAALEKQTKIILKPNIVNDSPHPVTTAPACVEAVIDYCQAHSRAALIIAEGCGGMDTHAAFRKLGYTELARRRGVELIDLDREPTVTLRNDSLRLLTEFPIPAVLQEGFLVSLPVLKAHSLSIVTLTLKNMFGIAPAAVYGGSYYRKSKLHGNNSAELHRYVVELNQYRCPDFTVLDASIGLAEQHLGGRRCSPPAAKILAGFDPVAVDAAGTRLLGFGWRDVPHIRWADGLLGHAEPEDGSGGGAFSCR